MATRPNVTQYCIQTAVITLKERRSDYKLTKALMSELLHVYLGLCRETCTNVFIQSNAFENVRRMLPSLSRPQSVNWLISWVVILHHCTWSTLVQIMAWCLVAPSHYLSHCRHEVLYHSPDGDFTGKAADINHWNIFVHKHTQGPTS